MSLSPNLHKVNNNILYPQPWDIILSWFSFGFCISINTFHQMKDAETIEGAVFHLACFDLAEF